MTFPQDPGIRADPAVAEGGTIEIHAGSGTREVFVLIPGHARVAVPIVSGRGEFHVPPSVIGGTQILISDLRFPSPSGTTVLVIGGQSR